MAANKEKRGVENSRPRTDYFRRGKGRFLESITDEILFEILVRLPAQDISFGARFVCHKWYHMIGTKNFIKKHLEHASYGLLYVGVLVDLVFTTPGEGGRIVDTYKLNCKLRDQIRSSWNGLILHYEDLRNEPIYCVTNVLTGQNLRLPPCPYFRPYGRVCAIGYDTTSTTYNVIAYYHNIRVDECVILTVGVDKTWRIVPTYHLSLRGKHTLGYIPITTEGFVHWKTSHDTKVVTLNLETEIITETDPSRAEEKNAQSWYLSTGRYISLFYSRESWAFEVFEMKSETREWRKFADICLERQRVRSVRNERLRFEPFNIGPFGWLKYPEMLALIINYEVIIFYYFITCEIGSETLSIYHSFVTLHKNSLEWLCGL